MYFENGPTESIRDIQTPHAQIVNNEIIFITSDNCLTVADRSILAKNSEFFRAKFNDPTADEVAIKLDFVDSATLELLLDFFYSGSIHINASNVETIFMAANSLRFI